jgi:hypothetical protein
MEQRGDQIRRPGFRIVRFGFRRLLLLLVR